jgi:hypothetical protein
MKKIRKKSVDARWISIKAWHEHYMIHPEAIRPIVLKIDERKQLVKVRPRSLSESTKILRQAFSGKTSSSSLVDGAQPLDKADLIQVVEEDAQG